MFLEGFSGILVAPVGVDDAGRSFGQAIADGKIFTFFVGNTVFGAGKVGFAIITNTVATLVRNTASTTLTGIDRFAGGGIGPNCAATTDLALVA